VKTEETPPFQRLKEETCLPLARSKQVSRMTQTSH
jgi:hypothetical protein